MNREKFFRDIKNEIPGKWWSFIYQYYRSSLIVIALNGSRSKQIKVDIGVKQGGPMSPIIFARYMDPLIELHKSEGILANINGIQTGILLYADDIVITTETMDDMVKCIGITEEFCKEYDITINGAKSQLIKFNSDYGTSDQIIIKNMQIKNEKTIKYLGVQLNEKLKNEQHIDERRYKANNALYIIKSMGAFSDAMDTNTKVHLYKTYVRPVLFYGLETLQLTKTDINKIQRNEHIMIKRMFGIYKKTHATKFLQALNIRSVEEELFDRKINLYVNLMKNDMTKKVSEELGKYIDDNRYHRNKDGEISPRTNKLNKLRNSFIMEVIDKTGSLSYDPAEIIGNGRLINKQNEQKNKNNQQDRDVKRIKECLQNYCSINRAVIINIIKVEFIT
jgi:hypothetical protein